MPAAASLWSDSTRLSGWNDYFSWIGWSLTLLGVLITAASIIIGQRIASLNAGEETKRTEKIKQLEAARMPRRLTPGQLNAIRSVMEASPDRPKIAIWFRGDDAETFDYAMQFNEFVHGIGYDTNWSQMMASLIPSGITLNTAYADSRVVDLMRRTFAAADIPIREATVRMAATDPPSTDALIIFGSKQ